MSFAQSWMNGQYGTFFVKFLLLAVNLGLLVFAAVGSIVAGPQWRRWLPIALPAVYVSFIHTFLFATVRYQIPIMPQVLVFSAVGIVGFRSFLLREGVEDG